MIFMDPVKKHFYVVRGVDRDKVPRRCREVTKDQMSKTASLNRDWELFDLNAYCIFNEDLCQVVHHGYRTANEARYYKDLWFKSPINEPHANLSIRRQADIITYL